MMSKEIRIHPIAHIESDFPQKFGIPRQSGIVANLEARIVFEDDYASPDAVRGLEGFSNIWLIWEFSEAEREDGAWTPTVRPPQLGGRKRMGVFATRSPFRPNPLGLSCVELDRVEITEEGKPILHIRGADLLDNTPIFDIKPYLPYADSRPEATSGWSGEAPRRHIEVDFPKEMLECLAESKRTAAIELLAQDPRPPLHDDADKHYTLAFAGFDIVFTVSDGRAHVESVAPSTLAAE